MSIHRVAEATAVEARHIHRAARLAAVAAVAAATAESGKACRQLFFNKLKSRLAAADEVKS